MMTDSPGRPEQPDQSAQNHQPDLDGQAEQTMSLNTAQAATQLGVDSRTVRRWITDGLHTPGGAILRLQARQVRSGRGPEYQIYQHDLEEFKAVRDRAATEGQAASPAARAEEQQALTTSISIISAELERRNLALAEAQQTIERLAREAGKSEVLERELQLMQERVKELTQERDHWRQKAQAKKSYRIRLFPIDEV
jgi:DNA repair exonuclease SbcCD ATPase subunit